MYVDSSKVSTQARVSASLMREIGEDEFRLWFLSLRLEAISATTAQASLASPFLAKRLQDNYGSALLRALQKETPTIERVEITARSFWKHSKHDEGVPRIPSAVSAAIDPEASKQDEDDTKVEVPPLCGRLALLPKVPGERILIAEIIDRVCAYYAMAPEALIGHSRKPDVVLPRHIAWFLAHHLTTNSNPAIGRRFGGRDHTTVLHGIRKVEELVKTDVELAFEIATIEANLRGMELLFPQDS